MVMPLSCPETCYILARAYHFGTSGMPQDKPYAFVLYREAAAQGHKKAKRAYENLKTYIIQDPPKDTNIKKSPSRNLLTKIKKRSKQKVQMKFLKAYFLMPNIRNKIFPTALNRVKTSGNSEHDSHSGSNFDEELIKSRSSHIHKNKQAEQDAVCNLVAVA